MSDFKTALIEGGIPLVGNVTVPGSCTLALKLFYAAVLSGEECVLSNIPRTKFVTEDLEIAVKLGIKADWTGNERLSIKSSELNSFIIPDEAKNISTSAFLVPALIHKFGKAVLPKCLRSGDYIKMWEQFGMEVRQDKNYFYIEAIKLHSAELVLPYSSRVLTDIAIITALFVPGETTILNASSDIETDDLISFCVKMGAEVKRGESNSISVKGTGVFNCVNSRLAYDREIAAFFITATLLTNGNTTLVDIERARMLPFINWLSKVNANYEFSGSDMRVWHNSGNYFEPATTSVSPYPGFMTDYTPFAVLLACFSNGESLVIENPKSTNLDFIKDLNKMGAEIDVIRCEEEIELHVKGPVKLNPGIVRVNSLKTALVTMLYALVVEGNSRIQNFDIITDGFYEISEKLTSIGASIDLEGL